VPRAPGSCAARPEAGRSLAGGHGGQSPTSSCAARWAIKSRHAQR
jgi:hypothetical protein